MKAKTYWADCIAEAAEECGLDLTPEQRDCLAGSVQIAHENYDMAFYSPPWSDRIGDIEREAKDKLRRLQAEFDAYRNNAETAVRKALNQHHDANVSIGEHGEVLLHGGGIDRIQ